MMKSLLMLGCLVSVVASPEACDSDGSDDVKLLQVAKADARNGAVGAASEHMDASSSGKFFLHTTKYCTVGTICAQESGHIDFARLSAFCVALTGGEYNPAIADLQEGTCPYFGFSCLATDEMITQELASARFIKALPSEMMQTIANHAATAVMGLVEGGLMTAVRDTVTVYTRKDDGLVCPVR